MISSEAYREWLQDVSRSPHRVLLIELDHADGTVRIGSDAYLDHEAPYYAYDDWLVGQPVIEDSLTNFRGVGDIDAVNFDDALDWRTLSWRGYACRWYHGDEDWPRSAFRRIATAMIGGCRHTGPKSYTFDLLDGGQAFKRRFTASDYTSTFSAKSTIRVALQGAGLPNADYYNIDAATRDFRVQTDYTPESILDVEIRKVVESIGAYMRVAQSGKLEIFILDTSAGPSLVLSEDDIIEGSVKEIEKTPAYKRVRVQMSINGPRTGSNNAQTGDLDQEITLDTVLSRTAEADQILADALDYYEIAHSVWQIDVLDIAGLMQIGDYIRIEHEELMRDGIVSHIRRSPLSQFSTIELMI